MDALTSNDKNEGKELAEILERLPEDERRAYEVFYSGLRQGIQIGMQRAG